MIRISGAHATAIAGQVFLRANGTAVDLKEQPSHTVLFGRIHDPASGVAIDEVLLTWMAGPRTYTTEDIVEISCHCGQLPLQETLRVVLAAGARHAEPGEFTLRAFLNGRLDLSQAESVLNVVGARTAESLQLAVADLQGELASRIAPASQAVTSLLAYLDAAADFPEDEIPGTDVDADLGQAIEVLEAIVAGSRAGMLYREGAQVALIGRPNVGKSSLMNALLRSDRAIVTPIAGTTRDVISETCNINGIPVTLLDTAGIAESTDVVEQLGIERSRRAMSGAAAVILVLDGSVDPNEEDLQVVSMLRSAAAGDEWRLRNERSPDFARDERDAQEVEVVIALNKHDLPERVGHEAVLGLLPGASVVRISSKTGEGLDDLEQSLAALLSQGEAVRPSLITVRQRAALERSLSHLNDAAATRAAGFPLDLMATDVRAALHAIGEVTGENVDEAVLTEIFSRFCIGK